MIPKADNIPAELRALRRWVVTDESKVPMDPATGRMASVIDPTTWGTFEDAMRAGKRVGFVLTEVDPYTIIDLDDKADNPATDEQRADHQRILAAFKGTYIERSISGRGYHIVCRGRVPRGIRRANIEVYSSGRFMIFTGDAL